MASNNGYGFTPTERRIFEVLKDGQTHAPRDLRKLLNDDQACPEALTMHISNMRDKLAGKGLAIFTIWDRRRAFYQLARRLADAALE